MANLPRGEVTGSNVGDAPVLPDFLDQIPSDEEIGSVTADGAYDTRKCHEAIAARGATAVRQGKGPTDPFRAFLTPALQERQAAETDKPQRPLQQVKPPVRARRVAIADHAGICAGKGLMAFFLCSDSGVTGAQFLDDFAFG